MQAQSVHAPDVTWSHAIGEWRIEVMPSAGAGHQAFEEELTARGVPLPFASHASVAALPENAPGYFIGIRDAAGHCVGGFAIVSRPAPLLRGHTLLRADHFGMSFPQDADDAVVEALRQWLRGVPRALRLSIDVFTFDDERRHSLAAILARNGFRRPRHVNGYLRTVVMDLSPTEDELWASINKSARRKVTHVAKVGFEPRIVDDPLYANRLNELLAETYQRTGGVIHTRDWESRIKMSVAAPDVSRIIGLFDPQITGPDSLIAFAWGCHCGSFVFYSEAASTRETRDPRVALAYVLMWDLIIWAKRTGARLYDFGGITGGTHADDDPLGGISDFKRYFAREEADVRDEWIMSDHTLRASWVGAIHRRLRGA